MTQSLHKRILCLAFFLLFEGSVPFLALPFVPLLFPSSTVLLAQSNSDWRQFRYAPNLTGVVESELKAPLKMAWSWDAEDGFESSAAIADQKIFAADLTGNLTALQLSDGKVLWQYLAHEYGIGESSPAVDENRVYIGDLYGNLHAVDATTGKKIWVFETQGEIRSSPVVINGKILIGSYDENLYCLSKQGELLWKAASQGPLHATPGILEGVAYISGCDGVLRGIRIEDGKEVFQYVTGSYTGASPALYEKRAYFGTHDNVVLAVDLAKSELIWSYQHPTRQFPFYSSAAVIDNRVILGGQDKFVHCIDADSGEAKWTFRAGARVDSSPAVVKNQVFIGSNDGRLYVLDLETGDRIWQFEAGGPIYASPTIAANRLVIGSLDGQLFCLEPMER